MKTVAESFAWPFRGRWRDAWPLGLITTLFVPVLFILVLGYAVAATRAAEENLTPGPPRWRVSFRMLGDGLTAAIAIALFTLPFALLLGPLSGAVQGAHLWRSSDPVVTDTFARVLAICILALPWGLLLLLHMPHATASFAATGNPTAMFDLGASFRGVRDDFATWNLAAAAIVTGWALGLACVGLLCVGLVPGLFYAILVSAHASAALHRTGKDSPTR